MTTEYNKYDRDTFEHEGIVWGAKIDASNDGKPLPWLKNDEHVFCYWSEATTGGPYDVDCVRGWDEGFQIRLPAEHSYYRATSLGFTYWPGGDEAPADADMNGGVILREGEVLFGDVSGCYWHHTNLVGDIIGYKRKVVAAQYTVPAPDIDATPTPTEDIVRVLRVIEYVGPRSAIEKQIMGAISGKRTYYGNITVNTMFVGGHPEILEGSK